MPDHTSVGEELIEMPIRGWHLELDRRDRAATVRAAARVDPERLVHPVLGWAGAVFARWDGHTPFHAGAFVHDGRAWMLLGSRESGKSSTLAALSSRGLTVLADDVVVVSGADALAGPRCIDLRPGVPDALALQDRVTTVRDGEVQRLGLGETPARVPLGGWFRLSWDDHYETRLLPAAERVRELHEHLTLRLEIPRPERVLDLVQLPGWDLARPRNGVGSLDRVVDELLGTLAGVV